MEFVTIYLKHRAKAFAGFLVPAITTAVLESVEKAFDLQLGTETKTAIIAFVTSQAVYWISNGPKEGAA